MDEKRIRTIKGAVEMFEGGRGNLLMLAYAVRDVLVNRWLDTQQSYYINNIRRYDEIKNNGVKWQIYYLGNGQGPAIGNPDGFKAWLLQ